MLQRLLACVTACFLFSQAFAQVPVQLTTGVIINTQPHQTPATHPDVFAPTIFQQRYYLWLQFNQLPNAALRTKLLATGVELYDYLPTNTFYASFPLNYDFEGLKSYAVYAVMAPPASYKIDPSLYTPLDISWAAPTDNTRHVRVSFSPAFSKQQLAQALSDAGILFSMLEADPSDALTITVELLQLTQIAAHPIVQFIEPIGAPPTLDDTQGVTSHRNNTVFTGDNYVNGRKLSGDGVIIAMGDDGHVGPHIDFQGRIQLNASNTSASNTHGDHVAGIILGAPNFDPDNRGQAPGAILRAYSGFGDLSLFPSLYTTNNVRITTHSLAQSCNAGYNNDARTSDQQIRTHTGLMHMHSAGNEGNSTCGGLTGGWRTITGGYKAGKNVLAVANLSKSDVAASGSSKGPTPDGRIKPDISAVGSSVMSTQPNNTYASMSGTSMASPAIAGNFAVLIEAYKKKHGAEPNSGLLKAIMLNTADDLGNPGPDFTHGFGRVNMRRAVECIENGRYSTNIIDQGTTHTISFTIPSNVAAAKFMVYWVDPQGTVGAAKALVNDIKTWVVSPFWGGEIHDPWRLFAGNAPTPSSCAAPATRGIDTTNNVEQVQIDDPQAGVYQLKIEGSKIPMGPQTYYVVYEYVMNTVTVTHPFGGESFTPGEVQRIRWDAPGNSGNFSVQYSSNEGSTWTTISSSVSAAQRYYDWSVPSLATGKARVKVTRGTTSDVSDTNFTIIGRPANVTFTQICQGQSRISWNAVSGATGYDVFKLGSEYMELIASTTATNVHLTGLGSSQNYFAVRAKLGHLMYGMRSNAVVHTNTSSATCALPVKLVSFNATRQEGDALITWTTAQEINILRYVVERSQTPSFETPVLVGDVKAQNSLSLQEYKLLDDEVDGRGIWYYRLRIEETDKTLYSNIEVVKWPDATAHFSLYPNPASSTLFLQLGKTFNSVSVDAFNAAGIRVMNKQLSAVNSATINVSALPAGSYFIVVTADGQVLNRQRLTIAR